jgi:hypothetical protein
MYRGTEHNRKINYSIKVSDTWGRNAHNNMSVLFNLISTL